jgi:hypothetical protein
MAQLVGLEIKARSGWRVKAGVPKLRYRGQQGCNNDHARQWQQMRRGDMGPIIYILFHIREEARLRDFPRRL